MRRRHGKRARLGGLLLAALGALALLALPSFAAARDHNHDHIPDRWEKRHHLSLKVNQDARDQDRDHLDNRGEFRAGDDPRNDDTDDDGVMDSDENAGTIASYDATTGRLTITLYGGDTVSGIVNDETEIRCGMDCRGHDRGDDSTASVSRHDEDGDNSGPGNSGDDQDNSGPPPTPPVSGPPGQGEDENDDPPGHDGTPPGASEGPGRGDDHGHHDDNDNDHHESCTTAALVVGAVVDEAELKLRNGVATFSEVELAQAEASSGQ